MLVVTDGATTKNEMWDSLKNERFEAVWPDAIHPASGGGLDETLNSAL